MNTNEKKNSRMQTRIRNVLKEAGLTIDDLTYLDPKLLLYYRNFGLKSYNDILDIMKESGLTPGTFCSIPYVKGPCNRGDIIDYYKTHKIEIQNKNQIQSTKTVDYKKAYQEALELARKIHSGEKVDSAAGLSALETIFPELRESEDEQSRKKIEQLIRLNTSGAEKTQLLAYLEKQKEQKPWKVGANAYFTPEQKPVVTHGETYHVDTLGTQQVIAGKMPQKPAWSEEDQLNLNWVIAILNGEPCDLDIQLESLISWLKSLRPSWKPSEEQMSMLRAIVNDPNNVGAESCHLAMQSLYNDLLKLK